MRIISGKPTLAALTAALMLALAAGTASADRSIAAEPSEILASGVLTFTEEGGNRLICPVTLHGTLHSLIAKMTGALVGYVTEALVGTCTTNVFAGALVAIPNLFPWHITYNSFSGELPNIDSVLLTVNNAGFLRRATIFGSRAQECQYRGSFGNIASGGRANEIERFVIQEEQIASLERALEERARRCARRGTLEGTLTTTTPITLELH